jgi:pyruvate formate lyase activating enzyme
MRFALQKTSLIDYPGKLACVAFLPGCNLRCPFCHNPELALPELFEAADDFIDREELSAFLKKRQGVLEALVISGGEALVNADAVSELIGLARSLGYKIKLDTNGLLPERLRDLDADYYAMDLKTAPTLYAERLPGSPPDAPERLLASMRLIRDSGKPHEFRTTLVPGIVGEAELVALRDIVLPEETFWLQRFRPQHCLDPSFEAVQPYSESGYAALLCLVQERLPRTKLR